SRPHSGRIDSCYPRREQGCCGRVIPKPLGDLVAVGLDLVRGKRGHLVTAGDIACCHEQMVAGGLIVYWQRTVPKKELQFIVGVRRDVIWLQLMVLVEDPVTNLRPQVGVVAARSMSIIQEHRRKRSDLLRFGDDSYLLDSCRRVVLL